MRLFKLWQAALAVLVLSACATNGAVANIFAQYPTRLPK